MRRNVGRFTDRSKKCAKEQVFASGLEMLMSFLAYAGLYRDTQLRGESKNVLILLSKI